MRANLNAAFKRAQRLPVLGVAFSSGEFNAGWSAPAVTSRNISGEPVVDCAKPGAGVLFGAGSGGVGSGRPVAAAF